MNKFNISQNVIAVLFLLILDILWLRLHMGKRYAVLVKDVQQTNLKVNYWFMLAAYALMMCGLILFVLPNVERTSAFKSSLIYGFGFGVVLYGVYNFTCAAIFEDWNFGILTQDILWGGTVYFLATYLSTLLASK